MKCKHCGREIISREWTKTGWMHENTLLCICKPGKRTLAEPDEKEAGE